MTSIIKKKIKSVLSKLKFLLGYNPRIDAKDHKKFIPEGYKTVCLISADFELAWAFRFSKNSSNNIDKAIEKGLRTRENVPKILKLCTQYDIPITWATVGHLFLESCEKENDIKHPEIMRLPKFENQFWRFDQDDWFEADPSTDYKKDPAWYCPDLINEIIQCPVEQEIGCHTFSHIDCRDEICTDEIFDSEMQACISAAKDFDITFETFVHPGHQIGKLQKLADYGFNNFRTDYGDTLSGPELHASGLWELKNSAGIEYREGWSTKYHVHRYIKILKRSVRKNKVCVLWFHPSFVEIVPDKILPEIFQFLNKNNKDILITTHKKYIHWLNSGNKTFNDER